MLDQPVRRLVYCTPASPGGGRQLLSICPSQSSSMPLQISDSGGRRPTQIVDHAPEAQVCVPRRQRPTPSGTSLPPQLRVSGAVELATLSMRPSQSLSTPSQVSVAGAPGVTGRPAPSTQTGIPASFTRITPVRAQAPTPEVQAGPMRTSAGAGASTVAASAMTASAGAAPSDRGGHDRGREHPHLPS